MFIAKGRRIGEEKPAGRPALPGLLLGFLVFAGLLIMAAELPVTELGVYNGADRTKKSVLTQDGTHLAIDTGINVDAATLVVDAANNRVGVGTASPAKKLSIASSVSGDAGLYFADTSVTSPGTTDFYSAYGNFYINTSSGITRFFGGGLNHEVDVYAASTRAVVIKGAGTTYFNGGNVAIGDTAAAKKLDVAGAANIDDDLTVGDFLQMTPTTEPGTPAAGMVYYDSSTNKIRCYNGTTWNDLF